MRKIKICEHISLDGVMQPGGPDENSEYSHGGWSAPYRTPEGAAALAASYGSGFDLLLGRRTYDLWSNFWPKMKGGPFADGSASVASVLLEQGLVDELVLAVYPLSLGRGKRIFSESADVREFALVSTKTTPTGVLLNTYRHVRDR